MKESPVFYRPNFQSACHYTVEYPADDHETRNEWRNRMDNAGDAIVAACVEPFKHILSARKIVAAGAVDYMIGQKKACRAFNDSAEKSRLMHDALGKLQRTFRAVSTTSHVRILLFPQYAGKKSELGLRVLFASPGATDIVNMETCANWLKS